ncbi:MAG: hypothetical protein GXP47_01375 [Acidobacteria bacterium]|nr:hypothetical protein [Acidobacteriota bacterium]
MGQRGPVAGWVLVLFAIGSASARGGPPEGFRTSVGFVNRTQRAVKAGWQGSPNETLKL